MADRTVVIIVKGGQVAKVSHLPKGWTYHIHDEDRTDLVDTIATGYEWECPYCKTLNKLTAWKQTDDCGGCGLAYNLMMPEHAIE